MRERVLELRLLLESDGPEEGLPDSYRLGLAFAATGNRSRCSNVAAEAL